MSLYEKYRPKSLKTIAGNELLKKDLRPYVRGERELPSAVLLTGNSGMGKTTLSRILAKASGAAQQDITELNAADDRGIDGIRNIIKSMYNMPMGGGTKRVWILDECAAITHQAQEALLKALESPPPHVHFILCTTDPQKLLKTILTRCTQFAVEPLAISDLVSVLQRICTQEVAEVPENVLKALAKQADGSARAAISALEVVLGRSPEDYDKPVIMQQEFESQVKALCQSLLKRQKWSAVAALLKDIKEEPENVRRAALGYMTAVLLSGKDAPQAALIIECFKEPLYNIGRAGLVLACYLSIQND